MQTTMNIIKSIAIGAVTVSSVMAEGWDQSLDLGATVSKGNSDSILGTFAYSGYNLGDKDEYLLDASYTYGESEDLKTNDELLASAQWNHLLSDITYAGLRVNARVDALADIDYRVGVTGLLGYYLIKSDTTYLSVEAGPGYTTEQVGGIDDDYLSIYIGQKFEHYLNDNTRIFETFALTAPADDFENYSIVFEAGIETFLSDRLALKLSVQDNYEAEPAAGADNNDIKVITGVSYKF